MNKQYVKKPSNMNIQPKQRERYQDTIKLFNRY